MNLALEIPSSSACVSEEIASWTKHDDEWDLKHKNICRKQKTE